MRHGPLDSFSAFPFENYLNKLKKTVRKNKDPLQQVVRRELERRSIAQDAILKTTNNLLGWTRPNYTGEHISSYEIYWNDTFNKVSNLSCIEMAVSKAIRNCIVSEIFPSIMYRLNLPFHFDLTCFLSNFFQEKLHQSLPVKETHVLVNLQPNTLYCFWLAAKSKQGEGATTSPISVRTDQ